MALPKKSSRTIMVDGVIYRWTIGPNNGFNILIAQHEGGSGQLIKAYFETDINAFWLEFSNVSYLNLKVLMPNEVAAIITQAIRLGWNPEAKGAPIAFNWMNEQLSVR